MEPLAGVIVEPLKPIVKAEEVAGSAPGLREGTGLEGASLMLWWELGFMTTKTTGKMTARATTMRVARPARMKYLSRFGLDFWEGGLEGEDDSLESGNRGPSASKGVFTRDESGNVGDEA